VPIPDLTCNSYPHGCPCGFYSDPVKECTCSAMAISRYQKKISGPLLDRIDIHVEVPRVDYEKLSDKRQAETSETIRKRVQTARERQLERFKGTKLKCNAEMGPNEVRTYCETDAPGEKLMKLARTIADLAGNDTILANHLAEAIQYRPRVGM
jgi:magnesium chelatase family protein